MARLRLPEKGPEKGTCEVRISVWGTLVRMRPSEIFYAVGKITVEIDGVKTEGVSHDELCAFHRSYLKYGKFFKECIVCEKAAGHPIRSTAANNVRISWADDEEIMQEQA